MESNIGPQIEVTKPPVFNGEAGRVGGFITTCKLYLRMKRGNGRGTSSMDSLIHTERISRCVEREYTRRLGGRRNRIQISWRISGRSKKGIWRRRQRDSEGGRVKEIRARGKNNGGICIGVQKGSEKK